MADLNERKYGPAPKPSEFLTIVFDEESEYVKFVRYVYETFDGEGLGFTSVPIITSARVSPELFARTEALFHMHPVTDADLAKVKERLKGHRPFDPETIRGRHVPGFKGPGQATK